MSFKDSKKKILSTMNSEVMTLASEDAFAVYVDDGYESVEGYTQYSQYTDDKYSMVDTNKNITMDSSQINITQEKNSQYIPFQMPRYYDGIDFGSDCFGKRFDRLYYRSISGDHRPDTGKSIPAYRSIQRIY